MLAAAMAFIAIANYKLNFFGNSRLLPVSLVMITALAFMMGLYFSNMSALFKIGGMMFFVAAALSGYGNWLPQVEGGFPPPEVKLDFGSMTPQQLADEGEKIIFGGIGQSKVQGAIGKGQCPLCHGFNEGFLSERAPNLFGIPERAKKQLEDPRYHKGKPGDRDTVQKESFPGAGTAETGQEYISESHSCPSCFVVAGFGVKGTNDKESPMPAIHKPPISLTLGELAAVDTWLYVREGKEPPSFEDITKAYDRSNRRINLRQVEEGCWRMVRSLLTRSLPRLSASFAIPSLVFPVQWARWGRSWSRRRMRLTELKIRRTRAVPRLSGSISLSP